ncbi:hypothetical protein O1L60_24290 [Streptomyces diastatochromogenes]|nr:hypothetical protein [Streptomyces diastatochromogenes]
MSVTPVPYVPAPVRPSRGRGRGALRHAAPALLGFLAVRLLGLAVLARWAHLRGHGLWPLLARSWDSLWYLDIAGHGYAAQPGYPRDLAFFPLFPGLVRALSAVLPGSPASVALGLAVVGSLAAAWGVRGRRPAARAPDRHGPRGPVGRLAGGRRAVDGVHGVGVHGVRRLGPVRGARRALGVGGGARGGRRADPADRARGRGGGLRGGLLAAARGERRALAAALTAPLGWLGYVGWVALVRGAGTATSRCSGAGEHLGRGAETLRELRRYLVHSPAPPFFLAVVSLVLLLSAGLYACCLADRQPAPLLVFTGCCCSSSSAATASGSPRPLPASGLPAAAAARRGDRPCPPARRRPRPHGGGAVLGVAGRPHAAGVGRGPVNGLSRSGR